MAFLLIAIGLLLIVVAYRSTMGDLVTALETDLPGFFIWGAAIGAILALGYVPALRTPSRALLLLVGIVIFLTQWQNVAAGLQSFRQAASSSPSGTPQADPTQAYATSGGQASPPTQAQITGTSGTSSTATTGAATSGAATTGATAAAATQAALNPAQALASLNPSSFLQSFTQSIGFGGLGG